jgi:hypothetical protein
MPPLEAIQWARGPPARLALLDQRLLPGTIEYIDVPDAAAAWTAIKVCVVLGRWQPVRCNAVFSGEGAFLTKTLAHWPNYARLWKARASGRVL